MRMRSLESCRIATYFQANGIGLVLAYICRGSLKGLRYNMKARYISSILALAVAGASWAQTVPVSLTNAAGDMVNGQTLHVMEELNGDPFQTLQQALTTTNITEETRTINVKRYEVDVLPGTQNYFCWTLCYDAVDAGERDVWVAHQAVSMAPGEEFNGFYGDYMPRGITGTSSFRFVWFDVDTEDSTWVDVVFTALDPNGVAERGMVRGFTAYPNPSIDGAVTFDYDLSPAVATGARLAFYNLLGERKRVKPLSAAQGRVQLSSDDLDSGVWFAVLERQGKTLATKRLVVAR